MPLVYLISLPYLRWLFLIGFLYVAAATQVMVATLFNLIIHHFFYGWFASGILPSPVSQGALVGLHNLLFLLALGATGYRLLAVRGNGQGLARWLDAVPLRESSRHPQYAILLEMNRRIAKAFRLSHPPTLHVMTEEDGINAVSAGILPDDRVIVLTQGCLDELDQSEQQAVIAHQMAHIVHKQGRFHLFLLWWMHGAEWLYVQAKHLIHRIDNSPRTMASMFILGLPLMFFTWFLIYLKIVGFLSWYLSRLLKAATARHRWAAADADAVRIMGRATPLIRLYKKMGGFSRQGYLRHASREEIGFLFMGDTHWETHFELNMTRHHPPYAVRIRQLDPHFDGQFAYQGYTGWGVPEGQSALADIKARSRAKKGSAGERHSAQLLENLPRVNWRKGVTPQEQALFAHLPDAVTTALPAPEALWIGIFSQLISDDAAVRAQQLEQISALWHEPNKAPDQARDHEIKGMLQSLAAWRAPASMVDRFKTLAFLLKQWPDPPPVSALDSRALDLLEALSHPADPQHQRFIYAAEQTIFRALDAKRLNTFAMGNRENSYKRLADELSTHLSMLISLADPSPEAGDAQFQRAARRLGQQGRISYRPEMAFDLALFRKNLLELEILAKDGRRFVVLASAECLYDGEKRLSHDGVSLMCAICAVLGHGNDKYLDEG